MFVGRCCSKTEGGRSVYKQYEAEAKALGDERLAIITDYADSIDTLSDEKARDLITRAVALEGKEHSLKERYLKELLAVLPAKVVARFFQVEARINNLIDLELSTQIPLVYSRPARRGGVTDPDAMQKTGRGRHMERSPVPIGSTWLGMRLTRASVGLNLK